MKLKSRTTIYIDAGSLAVANELIEEDENTSQFFQRLIREAGAARGYTVKTGLWHEGKLIKEM